MMTSAAAQRSVVIADDHPVVRIGVRNILAAAPEFRVVGEANDGEVAIQLVRTLRPDLLLLDLSMPKLPGLATLRALTDESVTLRTLVLTATINQKQVLEALQLGARGVVLKAAVADHLVDAMRAALDGRYWLGGQPVSNLVQAILHLAQKANPAQNAFNLTARELEVVAAIVEGCSNKDIAQRLSIAEDTVKRHLTNIFGKTGSSNRLELAMFALHNALVGR